MQDLLTHKNHKKRVIIIISIASSFIFLFSMIMVSFFAYSKNKRKYFEEKKLYLVYACKSLKKSEVSVNQKKIKDLGGAGNIYKNKDFYYLIVSVYTNKKDAEEIKNNVKNNFKEADVLTLNIKKYSRKDIDLLKTNSNCINFIKIVDAFNEEFIEKQLLFLSGLITVRDISTFLIEKRIKVETFINNFNSKDEPLFEKVFIYENMALMYLTNFLDKFFESTKKDSLICDIAVNMAILQFEMSNNL
ncbi:MAG: hypothetical protein IJX17_02130 [Clostridia bacterium]|nr:hypothetical protein [Clostridia bacterium]